jgi:hypothetical protein
MLTPLPEKSTAVLSHEGELDLMPDGPGCGAQSYVRALSERLASVILSRLRYFAARPQPVFGRWRGDHERVKRLGTARRSGMV